MSQPTGESPAPAEPPKLNVLALPSVTAILFGLIALVVLGAVFASVLPGSQMWWPPIVLGFILLSLRDYLRRPRTSLRRYRLTPVAGASVDQGQANEQLQPAVESIQHELADLAGDSPAPLVAVRSQPLAIHTFGTGRQRYVGIGQKNAVALDGRLRSSDEKKRRPARAILAHELAHFLNRDITMMGLSYSLLKMMILVMLANLWISFGLSLFIIDVSAEVLQPAFWDQMEQFWAGLLPGLPAPDLDWVLPRLEQQNPVVFARLADPGQSASIWATYFLFQVSAYLPFIVSGMVLFGLFWRRLLRVRELYADARAAALMGSNEAVRKGLALHATWSKLSKKAPHSRRLSIDWPRFKSIYRERVAPHFANHPDYELRKDCLDAPHKVFGAWRSMAVSAGLAVLMLELVLRGALTAGLIYQPGAHLAFAAGFVVFSLWLLPQWCLGRRRDDRLRQAVLGLVLLYTAIKLAPYLLDLAAVLLVQATNAEGWGVAIDLWIYALAGVAGDDLPRLMGIEVSWAQFMLWHILTPLAYFAVVMPAALLGFLWLDGALKRRTLTWYGLGSRVRRVWFVETVLLLAVLLLVIVPLTSRIFFPWVYEGLTPLAMAGLGAGLALLAVGAVAFLLTSRRWAGRCSCGAPVAGDFDLGATCPSCGAQLHEWLIASY
jgi:Zn-dependent protease with chaperone function